MYNIYTALVLIYIMYIYFVTYTSEAIRPGEKRPDPFFFLGQGGNILLTRYTHTHTCKGRKKGGRRNNFFAIDLHIPRDSIAKKNM